MNEDQIEVIKQVINHPDGEARLASRLGELHSVGFMIVTTNVLMVGSNLTAIIILSNSKRYRDW